MKIYSLLLLLCAISCQSISNSKIKQSSSSKQLVGADKDNHGCIGSAGYTWSVVKDSCIRVFEMGTPFVKYDAATGAIDATKVAYVVLSNDRRKAEVFFGGNDKPLIMNALSVTEGETMPVLFENETERLQLRSHRETYQLVSMGTICYLQYYDAQKGLGKILQKK